MYTNRFKIIFSPIHLYYLLNIMHLIFFFRQCLLPSHLHEPLIESITILLNDTNLMQYSHIKVLNSFIVLWLLKKWELQAWSYQRIVFFFFKTTVLNLLTSQREKISMPSSPNTMMLTAYATFELYTNTSKHNKNM